MSWWLQRKEETHVDKVNQKAKEKGVKVKTDVIMCISSVVKEIVEYSEKNKVDMIVIGSRGLSGIKKMLVGSVAIGVVTYAHCPVLVAKWEWPNPSHLEYRWLHIFPE